MKNIEVIQELVGAMSDLEPKNEALRIGVLAILDNLQQSSEPEQVEDKKPSKKKSAPKENSSEGQKRRPFDVGKAKACYDAGWSIAKIADEMRVTDQTVRNNLKKAGLLK